MKQQARFYHFFHGDLYYDSGLPSSPGIEAALGKDPGRHVAGPSDSLAVCYDSVDGTLFKHGSAERVEGWARKTRMAFADAGVPEFAEDIEVVSFLPHPEAVAELNACIETTGRVLRFKEALARIASSNPAYGQPQFPK